MGPLRQIEVVVKMPSFLFMKKYNLNVIYNRYKDLRYCNGERMKACIVGTKSTVIINLDRSLRNII